MDYRKEQNGNLITLWDDTEGIGLQFKQGETLQRYTSSVVMKDTAILSTEEGVAHLSEVEKALTAFAEAHYPKEFEPLKEEEA